MICLKIKRAILVSENGSFNSILFFQHTTLSPSLREEEYQE